MYGEYKCKGILSGDSDNTDSYQAWGEAPAQLKLAYVSEINWTNSEFVPMRKKT